MKQNNSIFTKTFARLWEKCLIGPSVYILVGVLSYSPILSAQVVIFDLSGDDISIESIIEDIQNNGGSAERSSTPQGVVYEVSVPVSFGGQITNFTYFENNDGSRELQVPGYGQVEVIPSPNGIPNLIVTTEVINESDGSASNLKCSGAGIASGYQCSLEPFIAITGKNIITADRLVVDATRGQDINFASATATNLKVSNNRESFKFGKDAYFGDSTLGVQFSGGSDSGSILSPPLSSGNLFENCSGVSCLVSSIANLLDSKPSALSPMIPSLDDLLSLPRTIRDSSHIVLNFNSNAFEVSKFKTDLVSGQEVSATMFRVSEGNGVQATVAISKEDKLAINAELRLNGSFSYYADPFNPSKDISIVSNSPAEIGFVVDLNDADPVGRLSVNIPVQNSFGQLSSVSFKDPRENKFTRSIDVIGHTEIIIEQGFSVKGDPIGDPVYLIQSDKMIVEDAKKNGDLIRVSEVDGLNGRLIRPSGSQSQQAFATADKMIQHRYKNNGVLDRTLGLEGNIEYWLLEDQFVKYQKGTADNAYITNDKHRAELIGDVEVEQLKYKNGQGPAVNGKYLDSSSYGVGREFSFVDYKGNQGQLIGNIEFQQYKYNDATSSIYLAADRGEMVTDNQDHISFNDRVIIQTNLVQTKGADGNKKDEVESLALYTLDAVAKNEKNKEQLTLLDSLINVDTKDVEGKKQFSYNFIGKKYEYINYEDNQTGTLTDASGIGFSSDLHKYGFIQVAAGALDKRLDSSLSSATGNSTEYNHIEFLSAAIYFEKDSRDSNNIKENLSGSIEELVANNDKYSVSLRGTKSDGSHELFKIYYDKHGEKGNEVRDIIIESEDGQMTSLEGFSKKEPESYRALFQSIRYFSSPEMEQYLVTNISGSVIRAQTDARGEETVVYSFMNGEGISENDGKIEHYVLNDGSIRTTKSLEDQNSNIKFRSAQYYANQTLDLKTIEAVGVVLSQTKKSKDVEQSVLGQIGSLSSIERGGETIVYTESGVLEFSSKKENKNYTGGITYGEIFYQALKAKDQGKGIKIINANQVSLVAVDIKDLTEMSGYFDQGVFYEDSTTRVIDIREIQNLKIDDKSDSPFSAIFNGRKFVIIDSKSEGVETRYLLVEQTTLNGIKMEKDTANLPTEVALKIGVLEVLNDKLKNKNYILRADVSASVKGDWGEAELRLKLTNITTDSSKSVSDDGKVTTKNFRIVGTSENARIDEIYVRAGPKYLKDAFSFNIKNGQAATFSVIRDKKMGQFIFMGVVDGVGSSTKIKLGPIKIQSKKNSTGSDFSIVATAYGFHMMNYLNTLNSHVTLMKMNNYISVNASGLLQFSTPKLFGFALELHFKHSELLNLSTITNLNGEEDEAATVLLGLSKTYASGSKTTVGAGLRGSSFYSVQTSDRCTLKVFGACTGTTSALPAHLVLFLNQKYNKDRNVIHFEIGFDGSTPVLKDADKEAQGLARGRKGSGVVVGVSYGWVLNKYKTHYSVGVGGSSMGDKGISFSAHHIY